MHLYCQSKDDEHFTDPGSLVAGSNVEQVWFLTGVQTSWSFLPTACISSHDSCANQYTVQSGIILMHDIITESANMGQQTLLRPQGVCAYNIQLALESVAAAQILMQKT